MTKKYAKAATPYQRVAADKRIPENVRTELARQYEQLNPAQILRDLLALQDQLLTMVKAQAHTNPTTGQTTTAHAGIHS